MKSKLNYSAQNILHVYNVVKEKKDNALKEISFKYSPAFGWITFNIEDIFSESGDESLKYKYIGYGSVNFLGNINGKIPSNGLYYKDIETKKQIEGLILTLSTIFEDEQDAIKQIRETHGEPSPDFCVLHGMANNFFR